MIIWVYDRWGNQINCLSDVMEFVHDDELGKIESVEFKVIGSPLQKGDYIVWRDRFANWHEDIVSSCEVIHRGSVYQHVYAEDSIVELDLNYINERNSYGFSNYVALTRALEDTRWETGNVELLGNGDIKFYHETVYEGITEMLNKWGGEISTEKRVDYTGVYSRRINWQAQKGSDNGVMFTYGFDADQIERHVELDNVITRLHVFGKGEPTFDESGNQTGNGRRLTFASINDGKDYLEDAEAMQKWGILDKYGKKIHAEGTVVFDQIEDKQTLLKLGKETFEKVKQPRVTYTANVVVLADAGMDFKNVQTGDVIYIHDEVLGERLTGRISHVRRFEVGNYPTEVTLGTVFRSVNNIIQEQQETLQSMKNRWAVWDAAGSADPDWLRSMMGSLNEDINATGGWTYWDYGEGITVLDAPRDQNPTMAIQLKGGSFRIANSKTSTGEWDWRTFGTGAGFTADEIIAGTIKGGANLLNLNTGDWLFLQGSIGDTAGLTYWDITNKRFRLTEENGQGIIYENGKLTINASSVFIGNTNIETWAADEITGEIEDVKNSITLQMASFENDVNAKLRVMENSISAKVSSADVQSAITASLQGIDLSVTNGALGKTASIKISSGNKTIDTASIDLTDVREAFRDDTTAITITGGTVTFNSNTFVVNSTYFKVKANGEITATSGKIGGFTITDTKIYNDTIELVSGGMYVTSDVGTGRIGHLGKTWITNYSNDKGIRLGLVYGSYNRFIDLASVQTSSGAGFTTYLKFVGRYMDSNNYSPGTFQSFGHWSFHKYNINDANINLDNCKMVTSGYSAITTTLRLSVITNVQNDGKFTYSNNCSMTFTQGVLTNFRWMNGQYG